MIGRAFPHLRLPVSSRRPIRATPHDLVIVACQCGVDTSFELTPEVELFTELQRLRQAGWARFCHVTAATLGNGTRRAVVSARQCPSCILSNSANSK